METLKRLWSTLWELAMLGAVAALFGWAAGGVVSIAAWNNPVVAGWLVGGTVWLYLVAWRYRQRHPPKSWPRRLREEIMRDAERERQRPQ